ncbi:MAG: prepilin peptidase [Pseudomonadota bacterium]
MLFSLVFAGFLIAACITDLKDFRIPNAIPIALIALFLIRAAATNDIVVWPDHLLAFGVTFFFGLVAFGLGLMGGGDAKLIAATALWFGVTTLPTFLAITAIGGGLFAIMLLALRHLAARQMQSEPPARSVSRPKLLDRRAPVPYALPIALSALWLEWHQWREFFA